MNDFRDEYRKADSVLVDVPVTFDDFAALQAARRERLIQHQEFLASLPRGRLQFSCPIPEYIEWSAPESNDSWDVAPCPY